MAVAVQIHGARRINPGSARPTIAVSVTCGVFHQVLEFDEPALQRLGDAASMISEINRVALAQANSQPRITGLPSSFPDIRGTTMVTGAMPVAGQGVTCRSVTVSGAVTTSDYAVWADATSAPVILTLPTAVGNAGQRFEFKKTDSSANAVTITPAGSEKIDGASTVVLSLKGQAATITSDGAGWIQVASPAAQVGASATDIANTTDAAAKAALTAIQAALAARGVVTSPA